MGSKHSKNNPPIPTTTSPIVQPPVFSEEVKQQQQTEQQQQSSQSAPINEVVEEPSSPMPLTPIPLFDTSTIAQDVQFYILSFLQTRDLYRLTLSSKYVAQLILEDENDEVLWKEIAKNYNIHPTESDFQAIEAMTFRFGSLNLNQNKRQNLWRKIVKHGLFFYWDATSRTPDTDIVISPDKTMISLQRESRWDTICVRVPLNVGNVYYWEYKLIEHDNGGFNSYRIFAGIERADYKFNEDQFDKIIGYNSNGVSYNIGEHTVHTNSQHGLTERSPLHDQHYLFTAGDVITFRLDMKNLIDNKATMDLFKNGEWFYTIKNIEPVTYYPAISAIGKQKVVVTRGARKLTYPDDHPMNSTPWIY
jgi:hypothetical protein